MRMQQQLKRSKRDTPRGTLQGLNIRFVNFTLEKVELWSTNIKKLVIEKPH